MIKTIIFDMDGVLLDSEPIHQRNNLEYFKQIGADVSEDFYRKNFIGLPGEQMFVYLKKAFRLSQDIQELQKECGRRLFQDFQKSALSPAEGVQSLLGYLSEEGYNLAVGSSSSPELIGLITEKLGIGHYFHILMSGYDVKRGKPHPDLFLKIAENFEMKPENCLVIEDSTLGLEAAWRAGMKSIGVKNPWTKQDLSRAVFTIDGFSSEGREQIISFVHKIL